MKQDGIDHVHYVNRGNGSNSQNLPTTFLDNFKEERRQSYNDNDLQK